MQTLGMRGQDTAVRWIAAAACCLAASVAPLRAEGQGRSIGAAAKPRFAVTDRVWPERPGEAAVCLWKHDALAALTITIDDNSAPDHDWWVAQGERTGWRFTWFVITCLVDKQPGYFGTWEQFARLHARGHDIQSHTVTHLNPDRGFREIVAEYRDSALEIERRIPGARVLTLAYPGGPQSASNSPAVAGQFYVAARGTRGTVNPANQTDYLQTTSIGGLQIENPKAAWADFLNVLEPGRYGGRGYRGWYCCHFHGMKPELRATTAAAFDTVKALGDDVWVGLFREVALYGQERDTAALRTGVGEDGSLRLTLTDTLDNALFDHPLTVKVRLPEGWRGVAATQAGQAAKVSVLEHAAARFALVEAVPDRGEVIVNRVE